MMTRVAHAQLTEPTLQSSLVMRSFPSTTTLSYYYYFLFFMLQNTPQEHLDEGKGVRPRRKGSQSAPQRTTDKNNSNNSSKT